MRLWLVLIALVFSASLGVQPHRDLKPTVILVSFDGWRWDYHLRAPAPNLRRLMARGVRADGLIPSFPSKTFPNHYTIVTGLYPGHHGIVANNIWDAARQRAFSLTNRAAIRDATWWGGEPIWNTAERAGQRAAPLFWPGSEAPIGGIRPTYSETYDEEMPPSDRIEWVLRKLDLPAAQRPTFLTLYFEDLDDAGHSDGPDSLAVRNAITRADGYLGELIAGLQQRNLAERVNVIVVSDHGMSGISPSRVVVVDDYISLDDVMVADINPTLGLFPKPEKEEAVYRALRAAHPRLKIYRRAETPDRWHYRYHPNIPPLIGVVDEGWQVLRRSTLEEIRSGKTRASGGNHGYDPRYQSMRGIFVAAGPAFKHDERVRAFENVDIYNTLAAVLGITPASNDGDPRTVRRLLAEPRN